MPPPLSPPCPAPFVQTADDDADDDADNGADNGAENGEDAKSPDEQVGALLNRELVLTQRGFKRNPKSYWVWHHRRWATKVRRGLSVCLCPLMLLAGCFAAYAWTLFALLTFDFANLFTPPSPRLTRGHAAQTHPLCDWETELGLCSHFLDLDKRNFHCWGYRRYVVAATGGAVTPVNEFDYTTKKINQSFSNYSAWHYRSSLFTVVRLVCVCVCVCVLRFGGDQTWLCVFDLSACFVGWCTPCGA